MSVFTNFRPCRHLRCVVSTLNFLTSLSFGAVSFLASLAGVSAAVLYFRQPSFLNRLPLRPVSDVTGDRSPLCDKMLSAPSLLMRPAGRLVWLVLEWMSCSRMAVESASLPPISRYMAAICGVITPWLMVRLCFWRNDRRVLAITLLESISSCEMTAFGERLASGCGSVVLRSGLVSFNNLNFTVWWLPYLRWKAQENRCYEGCFGSSCSWLTGFVVWRSFCEALRWCNLSFCGGSIEDKIVRDSMRDGDGRRNGLDLEWLIFNGIVASWGHRRRWKRAGEWVEWETALCSD